MKTRIISLIAVLKFLPLNIIGESKSMCLLSLVEVGPIEEWVLVDVWKCNGKPTMKVLASRWRE